jgi:hypothetical protein
VNGRCWSGLGNGLNSDVLAVAVAVAADGSHVYVGGSFSRPGDATALRIARWSGNQWSALGTGLSQGVNGPVQPG